MGKMKRQDGWWYPWVFVAAFGLIMAVNGTMAYLAVHTWTGLTTKHPFEEAQHFEKAIAQKAAQEKLGWRAMAAFEAVPTSAPSSALARTGSVRFSLLDRNGRGIDNLTINAQAKRPTNEGSDQTLNFKAQGSGVYAAPVNFPLAGQWDIYITATRADDVFEMRQRIQVP
jgi:nitrogen fixation protein FixH